MALTASIATMHAGTIVSTPSDSPSTRYGLFNLLDHRSSYGQGVFPEPFLVDDSDLETDEFRIDDNHTTIPGSHADEFTVEIEKGFGLLTLELEVHFDREVSRTEGRIGGFDNVDIGARYPIAQYVSPSGFIDTTFGVGFEVGIPTDSRVSKNAEFVPKVFNDLRIGSHFTLQSIVGFSALTGPGEEGGLDTLEYGFVIGWTIPHKEIPIPGVEAIIPVFEISGEHALNGPDEGTDAVVGNAAVRVNLKSIGPIQPRLGVGYTFPMNQNAREDFHSGIYTSLVFEY